MIRRWCYLSTLLALFSVLLACSGSSSLVRSSTPPDWTLGESAKYPHALYITATGSSSEPESAKDRAMGNLAKVFESHIVENSTTLSDTRSRRTSGSEEVEVEQRLVRRINIRSNKVFEGLRIAEQWQNSADLTYYALAVIERQHASNMLQNEMKRLDKDSAFELNSIRSQKDDLKRISAYQRVTRLQEARNNLQKLLKVVDLKGKGLPTKWSLVELKALAASALTEVKMSAYVHPQGLAGLKQQLQAAMSNAGFPAVDGKADYTLLAEVELQDPQKNQGWYWLRGSLEVRLIDASSGVTRGRHSWSLKVSATQQSQLMSRFKKEIDKTLKKNLHDLLIEIADSD